jgi:2'-5' RNA ligase
MDSGSKDEILAYWLIPAEPARSWFRSLIHDLARRLEAPVFEPHVTLYVTKAAAENPGRVLRNVLADQKPVRLSVSGLECSEAFTKTLFVQFQPDAVLARLGHELRSASVSQLEYELNPHLSLVYKRMRLEEKNEVMNSIRLPFGEVDFDSVKAVISPAKIESRADVESWRVVATQELAK